MRTRSQKIGKFARRGPADEKFISLEQRPPVHPSELYECTN